MHYAQNHPSREIKATQPIYFIGAYVRHDHRIRRPVLPVWKSDIALIGQARADESRVVLIRKLADRFNVKVYGKNWQAFGIKPTLKAVTPRSYALICRGRKSFLTLISPTRWKAIDPTVSG